jgi:hypothetical protein
VDPRQVHKAAAKIDFEKLINILKSATGNNELPINLNYPTFIKNTITDFINQSNDTPEVKAKQIEDINNIMSYLNRTTLKTYINLARIKKVVILKRLCPLWMM